MKKNMGSADRWIRGIVGVVLLALVIWGGMAVAWNWILGIIGVVLIVTALVGVCPAYLPFSINTGAKS